jgi:glucose-6-phosphate isomerase
MKVDAEIRTVGDLKPVLMQPYSADGIEKEPAYFMFRDLAKNKADSEAVRESGLRYDITVMPPRTLGIEYVKTLGHSHQNVPKTDVTYPELYQVVTGRAHYILQKIGRENAAEDAVVVEAKEGEMVLVPPGYAHVTVNPKGVELTMANWVCRDFKSEYDLIKRMRGLAYYETVENNWLVNKVYQDPAPLRRRRPIDPSTFDLSEREDMYKLVSNLGSLDFLANPHKNAQMFLGLP